VRARHAAPVRAFCCTTRDPNGARAATVEDVPVNALVVSRARRRALFFSGCLALLGCADPSAEPADAASSPPTMQEGGAQAGGDAGWQGGGADAGAPPRDGSADPDGGADSSADAGTSQGDAAAEGGAAGSDDILGSPVARNESFWVAEGRIHYADRALQLYGLNWFGLETDARALFGVQEANRSVADFLAQVKSLGFNALRVPLSPESIDEGFPNPDWAKRGAIDTGREHFEELAAAAKEAGLYMLWDIHTCASAVGYRKTGPLDPACTGYGKDKWLANLGTLANLAKNYAPYVVGIDLFNEPYGLTWEAWKALAEEGGRVVLRENPRILTFVEGVGSEGYQGAEAVFWGENLTGVRQAPIDLPAARLVYSPHVYGPSVFAQPYFAASGFPANMPAIWDNHFGFLFGQPSAVVPGEFGGKYTDGDKTWQDAFVDYLRAKSTSRSFFYWSLNPNSGDTGGLLLDDWRTVNMDKLELLKRLQQ
jgi:endoglucanase